jgi:hypothetical protein
MPAIVDAKTMMMTTPKIHAFDQPMCLTATHVYKSAGKNCSQITRHIMEQALESIEIYLSTATIMAIKKKKLRLNKMERKLNALPKPLLTDKNVVELTALTQKLYVSGLNIEDLPTLPTNSLPWTVREKFTIFNNNDGKGCYLAGGFMLVPREFVKYVFDETKQFFAAFEKILKVHKNLDPCGDHKVAPATYFTAGQSAQRFGKGLFEVHHKLKHQKQMQEHSALLHNYMAKATHVTTSYMNPKDRLFAKFVKVMAKLNDFCIANNLPVKTIWTSIAIAMNVAIEKHIDDDLFIGLVGVLGRSGYHQDDSSEDSILQYFCFPVLGSAVALRNGDMLMFNP